MVLNTADANSQFRNFVGNVAVFMTVLQFLSGVLVCRQYVVNKTTADASPLPFVCGVLSAGLWLLYGVSKNDDKIVFVNTIGLTLMMIYVIVFYKYTTKKRSLLKQILFCVVFGLFICGYISFENDNERLFSTLASPDVGAGAKALRRKCVTLKAYAKQYKLQIPGSAACYLTIMTVAAPLSKFFHVIKVKNTECLPFPMILMSLFVSTLWLLYGHLDGDLFITVPNEIGIVLALSQLVLFVIYPSKPKSPAKSLLA